jgi:hypothetical protein
MCDQEVFCSNEPALGRFSKFGLILLVDTGEGSSNNPFLSYYYGIAEVRCSFNASL